MAITLRCAHRPGDRDLRRRRAMARARPRPAPASAAGGRPGRPASRPSPASVLARTRAAGRTRCRALPGCTAPGRWRRRRRRAAAQLLHLAASKLETPQCADLARPAQRLERRPRFRRTDGCRASAADRGRCTSVRSRLRLRAQAAGTPRAGGVVRIDLADRRTPASRRPAIACGDHFLGAAVGVHLGGVDQRHAEIDAEPQRVGLAPRRRRRARPCARCPGRAPATSVPSGSATRAHHVRRAASAARSTRRKLPPHSAASSAAP